MKRLKNLFTLAALCIASSVAFGQDGPLTVWNTSSVTIVVSPVAVDDCSGSKDYLTSVSIAPGQHHDFLPTYSSTTYPDAHWGVIRCAASNTPYYGYDANYSCSPLSYFSGVNWQTRKGRW